MFMRTRSGATSTPGAGPRSSSIRSGTIAARIDTRGPGTPVVVFNPLSWPRADIAEVEIGFAAGGVTDVDVTGPGGETVPAQILEATHYADGGMKTARVAFVARDVPALGYGTYHVAPSRRAGRAVAVAGHPGAA